MISEGKSTYLPMFEKLKPYLPELKQRYEEAAMKAEELR